MHKAIISVLQRCERSTKGNATDVRIEHSAETVRTGRLAQPNKRNRSSLIAHTVLVGRIWQWTVGVSARSPLYFRGRDLDTASSVRGSAIHPPGLKHRLRKYGIKYEAELVKKKRSPGDLFPKIFNSFQLETIGNSNQFVFATHFREKKSQIVFCKN